jgi:hypothetical protein
MAANLMMGYDENCLAWIAAHRDAAIDAGAQASPAADSRAARDARRAARRSG